MCKITEIGEMTEKEWAVYQAGLKRWQENQDKYSYLHSDIAAEHLSHQAAEHQLMMYRRATRYRTGNRGW